MEVREKENLGKKQVCNFLQLGMGRGWRKLEQKASHSTLYVLRNLQ